MSRIMATYFFKKGPVRILSSGREGRLLGPSRPGTYRVLVDHEVLDCHEDDLQPLGEKPEDRKVPAGAERQTKGARLGKFEASPMFSNTIDVHGLNVRHAIEMVERKINRALLADCDRIRIVHEKDASKLCRALDQFLSSQRYVAGYAQDEENPSVTWVYFK